MKRFDAAHRYDVRIERAFAFITDTANLLAGGASRAFERTSAALEQELASSEDEPAVATP